MERNEVQLVLNGTTRDYFLDLKFPEFNGAAKKITLDLLQSPANLVPFRYKDGKDTFIQGEGFAPSTMMCVFKLHGDDVSLDDQMKVIGAWTHELNLDPEKFHVSMRLLSNETTGRARTFIYRIYMNVEGECTEHPEMLTGAPIGMYHCPACGEMVVAGLRHPTAEEIRLFNEGIDEELKQAEQQTTEWEAGEAECIDMPYTPEQVAMLNADYAAELEESRKRKELFNSKFRVCQTAFESYTKLEDDWDGMGAAKTNPDYMKTAFNFMMFVSDHADLEKARPANPTLDHDGVPGVYWRAVDGKNYVSLAFYADEIVWFVKSENHPTGQSGTLKLSESIEPQLLLIVNEWPNQNVMPQSLQD